MVLRWKPRPFPFGPILSQSYCSLKRVESLATRATQFEVRAGAPHELDLVHASKSGDVDAFEQLVKRAFSGGNILVRHLSSPNIPRFAGR